MFHSPIDRRGIGERPLPFPAPLDLCRDRASASAACDGLRFATEARRSSSGQAFRPAFAAADWRVFASFCVARRLPADHRVLVPGRLDRTLRFVVEGSLWQEPAAATPASGRARLLMPGAIVGEDGLFLDTPCEVDVRTLEASLVLELTLPRHKELVAACPGIGFELLRAAGAVIAARGRTSGLRAESAAN
jgi:hypothetical protein